MAHYSININMIRHMRFPFICFVSRLHLHDADVEKKLSVVVVDLRNSHIQFINLSYYLIFSGYRVKVWKGVKD